ncbi:receptor-like serine/threonine-protein kinase At2g45590 isoform X2 [Andrographis paniculata]|uniref:receptor-like serine/threonine-protein kinase At2g45590 isoform X2 n=1 Tax=Andrographis paniculata TaxID=175694 RepID=UPI0021E7AC14|nr:receptor-like serine/threonine-protein kinase At2g45590 isoform X2 [Andrographis paniculata]
MPPPPPRRPHVPIVPAVIAAAMCLAFLCLFIILYRKITRKRTVPTDLMKPPFPPQRFSYSALNRATASFSAANRLGQGGFGSVYKGVLPSGQEIAVKLMSDVSIQGEREFQNELSLASGIDTVCCPYIVCVLGFSTSDGRKGYGFRYCGRQKKWGRRRLALVYEFMPNGSLQDALLDRKCEQLMQWDKRFAIITSVAKGLDYLHSCCDPPVIHGDIKPSNILLDCNFDAKIADFGLAQVLTRGEETVADIFMEEEEEDEDEEKTEKKGGVGETEGVVMEDAVVVNVELSPPESYCVRILDEEEGLGVVGEGSASEGITDRISMDSGSRNVVLERGKGESDWWWKQENMNGLSDSKREVKDYVKEWIGSEISKERPKKEDLIKSKSSVEEGMEVEQTKPGKRLEWWPSLDREALRKEKKDRKPREWWKEEFCDELAKKSRNKKRELLKMDCEGELWWQRDEAGNGLPERKRRRSRGSRSSIDRWLDGFSGEFRLGKRNSQDFASGEIPKSGGISSTPSMRGTVCYIAPECSAGSPVSDKCDVYSFGVLLLVMVSGRRPLQVMASPMSEFERANLISWTRQLALNGRLVDLVDPNIQSLDREQAVLCITIALLCLQRSPNKRPTMKEAVEMLSGNSEPPHLPFEFSPSPPSNFPFKLKKKFSSHYR